MAAFLTQFRVEYRSRVTLTIWALLTSFLSITGPFGAAEKLGLLPRFLFWALIMTVTMLVGAASRAYVTTAFGQCSFRVRATAIAAMVSCTMAPVLWLLSLPMAHYFGTVVPSFAQLLLLLASISLGVSSLRQAVHPEAVAASVPLPISAAASDQVTMAEQPRLFGRIEPYLHGALQSISVRDHYVDVSTSAGVASLLLRLSDAMAETDPVAGDQIHRSHWVAWDAVQGIERDGVKLFVLLPGGVRLPVSKNHREKLVARGLL